MYLVGVPSQIALVFPPTDGLPRKAANGIFSQAWAEGIRASGQVQQREPVGNLGTLPERVVRNERQTRADRD